MEEYIDREDSANELEEEKSPKKRLTSKTKSKKKEIVKNKLVFEDYFEAYKNRNDYMSSTKESVNQLEFNLDSYTETLENLKRKTLSKGILAEEASLENTEDVNKLTYLGLYDVIIEFLRAESNVLLYGYGSKLKLIHSFISYFQEKVIDMYEQDYHILVFNCFNPEVTFKFLLSEIISYLINLRGYNDGSIDSQLKKCKTVNDQICYISKLIDFLAENGEERPKILLILNNIDGPNFQSKTSQTFLALLVEVCQFRLLATSDNLYINYFWNQTVKDNFSFYFLKFHTFRPYEVEINEKNSLVGSKTMKYGNGLLEVYKSLTKNARDVLKVIAELQTKNDSSLLTCKKIVDYMVDKGLGICNNINRFMELILEPLDHNILVLKKFNEKDIYKLNLEAEVLERIKKGELDDEIEEEAKYNK